MSSSPNPLPLDVQSVSVPTRVLSHNDPDIPNPAVCTLRLDPQEEKLFETLVATATAFEQGTLSVTTIQKATPAPLQVRVAGGWVRDKILGLQTHDVDVAINCMSGVEFATLVQNYLKQSNSLECGKMGVIAANPSQSKHLETAAMRVHGMDVDFCNLRSQEIYESHSRIPTTQLGTPLEDALRRDCTINALFFNLQTRQVEDWTQRGLPDLRQGIIETPLDPRTTFHDDPLRVLRAIRFAVRYQFRLDSALEQACMCQEVHKSLHVKVSRERAGKELEGMLSGKGARPSQALDTIARLKLAGSVFCVPADSDCQGIRGTVLGHEYAGDHAACSHLRELGWEESRRLATLLVQLQDEGGSPLLASELQAKTTLDSRLLQLAVFLSPFRLLTYTDLRGRDFTVVSYMIKEGVKFKNRDLAGINSLMENVDAMLNLLHIFGSKPSQDGTAVSRLDAGLLLQQCKGLWVTCLVFATVLKLRSEQVRNPDQAGELILQNRQLCQRVYRAILEMNLDECWKMKPLLNGTAIVQALNIERGPVVGEYIREQIRWMLVHPNGSREECTRHLLSLKRQLEGVEHNEQTLGVSDGGPSSPVEPKATCQHFSKRMHLESMDSTD